MKPAPSSPRRSARRILQSAFFILPFCFSASAQVLITRTFTPALLIPDSGEAADVRTIDVGGGTISNLKVDVTLSGVNGPMFNGDYYISLGHGTGSAVLLNRPGVTASNPFGYADNGIAATFADNAVNGDAHNYRTTLGGAPSGGILTGTWAPDGRLTDPLSDTRTANLATFNGVAPSGEWRLFISDEGAGGTARLDSWRLHMTVTPDGTSQMRLSDAQLTASATQTLTNPLQVTGASRISGTADVTLQGALSGTGSLQKENNGRLILADPNAFAGAINITAGTLELPSGFGGSGGGITVGAGTTLTAGGSITRDITHQGTIEGPALGSGQFLSFNGAVTGAGSFQGRILMNGSFSPGNSPAISSFTGDYTLGSLNLLTMEIGGLTPGTQHDQIQVSNTLTYGGTLQLVLLNGFTPTAGNTFQLFTAGSFIGTFASYDLASLPASLQWDTSLLASQGTLGVTASAVPEPAAYTAILGLATLAFALQRRRATGK